MLQDDDEHRLAHRVLEQEHVIYPQAIRWFLNDYLTIQGDRVRLLAHCQAPGAMISPLPQ